MAPFVSSRPLKTVTLIHLKKFTCGALLCVDITVFVNIGFSDIFYHTSIICLVEVVICVDKCFQLYSKPVLVEYRHLY